MALTSLVLAFVLVAGVSRAANPSNPGNVTLAWERSPDDVLTNGFIYRIQSGTNLVAGSIVSLTNIVAGTNTSVTITNLPAATWYFTATASQGGVESLPSNMIAYVVPATRPRAPGSLATMFLEMTLNLTNYSDVGMFRARIFVPSP